MKKTAFVTFIKSMSILLFLTMIVGVNIIVAAEAKPEKQPLNKELLEQYGSKVEINYLIPRPSVIAEILHQNQFKFTGEINPEKNNNYAGSVKIALNLGSRCTDGIMMVYGERKSSDQALEDLGDTILKLTADLGLENNLKGIDPLKGALKSKKQDEIKNSIDTLFAESELFLRQRDDNDLAMLVSLGGWIEMMYYASGELSTNYQTQSSKVLAQDYIVDVYINALSKLKIFVQESPVLLTITRQLPEVKRLMDNPTDQQISQEAVKGIYAIAKNLKLEIEKQ
jgi:hypothetical protein